MLKSDGWVFNNVLLLLMVLSKSVRLMTYPLRDAWVQQGAYRLKTAASVLGRVVALNMHLARVVTDLRLC